MSEPAVFQVTVPAPYAADFKDAVDEAAAEAGVTDGFSLDEGDPGSAPSEMQFDPVIASVGLWVGHLILNEVGSMTVKSIINKLVEKIRAKMKPGSSDQPAAKIVLLLPDMSKVTLDLTDAQDVEIKLKKLA
jgi:hypothetical protein